MIALITGITVQDGTYPAQFLLQIGLYSLRKISPNGFNKLSAYWMSSVCGTIKTCTWLNMI